MHLINKPNRMNQTPIYLACRNGNLEIVKYLLEQQANPHILSNVDDEEKESTLQVACRWNHRQVVEYIIDAVQWKEADIRATIKMEGLEEEIVKILKVYAKKRFSCLFNFCLCA